MGGGIRNPWFIQVEGWCGRRAPRASSLKWWPGWVSCTAPHPHLTTHTTHSPPHPPHLTYIHTYIHAYIWNNRIKTIQTGIQEGRRRQGWEKKRRERITILSLSLLIIWGYVRYLHRQLILKSSSISNSFSWSISSSSSSSSYLSSSATLPSSYQLSDDLSINPIQSI